MLTRPYSYNQLRRRCDAIAKIRNDRARQLCADAGLDPTLLGIHPHNAQCSYEYGKPWPDVDYHKVRECLHEIDRQWDAARILDRLYARLGYSAFTWGDN